MSVTLHRCTACAHVCFPARQICHRCGGALWTPVMADRGVVEEVTIVRYQADAAPGASTATYLAWVRTGDGVALVARLNRMAEPGSEVMLGYAANGGIAGR